MLQFPSRNAVESNPVKVETSQLIFFLIWQTMPTLIFIFSLFRELIDKLEDK